jgi:hypothetical protein
VHGADRINSGFAGKRLEAAVGTGLNLALALEAVERNHQFQRHAGPFFFFLEITNKRS